jgi:ketol-acid reductoisomerase
MAQPYCEKDCDPKALRGRIVAVIGYGSQGRVPALDPRDSGPRNVTQETRRR